MRFKSYLTGLICLLSVVFIYFFSSSPVYSCTYTTGYGCTGTCSGVNECTYTGQGTCGCYPPPTIPPQASPTQAPTITPRPTQIPITPGDPTPTGLWFNCGTGTYCGTGYYCCSLNQCCAVGPLTPTGSGGGPTNTPVPTNTPTPTPTPIPTPGPWIKLKNTSYISKITA